jgi:serine/threonine protein kinase
MSVRQFVIFKAPESLQGLGYDIKSDIFSAGVILYGLLSGRPVFQGANYNELIQKNREGVAIFHEKYWSKISEEGKDLTSKMLNPDPE